MTFYGHIKNFFRPRMEMMGEARRFLWMNLKYNASIGSSKDPDKLCYMILREAHTLEKGMSLRNPRQGFGKQKATHLMGRMEEYARRYGYSPSISNSLSIVDGYLAYSKQTGTDVSELDKRFDALLQQFGRPQYLKSPCTIEISNGSPVSYEDVILSRHSCRYFKDEPVDESLIVKALELASHTPSACNRQAWRTHVFAGDDCRRLLEWQGGCKGFEDEPKTCILVTADRKAFLHYKMFQPYVDGGMYAMNLLNALHSLSLATLPVSCGFHYGKLKALKDFGIPENEVPIVIIGTGYSEETTRVAASVRKAVPETNTFHR